MKISHWVGAVNSEKKTESQFELMEKIKISDDMDNQRTNGF